MEGWCRQVVLDLSQTASFCLTSVIHHLDQSTGRLRKVLLRPSTQHICALSSFSPKNPGTRAAIACIISLQRHVCRIPAILAFIGMPPASSCTILVHANEFGEPVKAYEY